MAGLKNAGATVLVAGILLFGLFVLFPETAQAAKVETMTSTALDPDGAFEVTVGVLIPAGEFVPLDYARVLVASKTTALAGGSLSSPFCVASTGGFNSATITAVQGAEATYGEFHGYGYVVGGVDPGHGYSYGYGLDFNNGHEVFAGVDGGYGYGYGKTDVSVRVEVTILVSGCSFFVGGPTGDPASAAETFRIQAFIGGDSQHTIPSFPLSVVFANQDYTPPINTVGELLSDGSGLTLVGGKLTKGVASKVTDFPPGTPLRSVSITPTKADLEAGTRLIVRTAATADPKAPSFGFPELSGAFPNPRSVALQFQPVLQYPDGSTTTDLNGILTLKTNVNVPESFFQGLVDNNIFTSVDQASTYFRVFAYESNGALKSYYKQPATKFIEKDGTDYVYEVTIKHFSTFAAGSTTFSVGRGGGGGGTPVVEPPVNPPTNNDGGGNETEDPVVDPPIDNKNETKDPLNEDKGKKSPGAGVVLTLLAAVGVALFVRGRRN